MKTPLFYKDRPLFGFDIGHNTIKVVQFERGHNSHLKVVGYGYNTFNEAAMKDGAITDIKSMAASTHPLLTQMMVGTITTNRVAVSIPASRSFTRILTLPYMEGDDLTQAVQLEAEQYIPIPPAELYIDHEVTKVIAGTSPGADRQIEVVMVAAPKKIVDSYLNLLDVLGLEAALIEPSLVANARAYAHNHPTAKPLLLIDFGSRSSDINIFDGSLRVAGTIDGGGDGMTDAIAKAFKVTTHQAYILKTRYGLKPGPKQKDIKTALAPMMDNLVKEINKMLRYYKDREAGVKDIEGITMSGGGANLPGLSEYLTAQVKINTLVDNPWEKADFGRFQQPHHLESTIYTTAVGLALSGLGARK